MTRIIAAISAVFITFAMYGLAQAEPSHIPMTGSNLIQGYNTKTDAGAKGRYKVDLDKGVISGGFKGLKAVEGRTAVMAWVHDTVNQKSELIGGVKIISAKNASGKFKIALPEKYKSGDFGSYEILGFTYEEDGTLEKDGKAFKVVNAPAEPSGTKKVPSPAFYLFGALPGADTEQHFCGHGKDFFYAKAPETQTCYDCKCRQKYSACIKAGA